MEEAQAQAMAFCLSSFMCKKHATPKTKAPKFQAQSLLPPPIYHRPHKGKEAGEGRQASPFSFSQSCLIKEEEGGSLFLPSPLRKWEQAGSLLCPKGQTQME